MKLAIRAGLIGSLLAAALCGPATALHRDDAPDLARLARKLEIQADGTYDRARALIHHGDRGELRFIQALRRFRSAASQFERQVSSRWFSEGAVRRDLDRLNWHGDQVDRSIHQGHTLRDVERDWRGTAYTLRTINRIADRSSGLDDRHAGDDRRWRRGYDRYRDENLPRGLGSIRIRSGDRW